MVLGALAGCLHPNSVVCEDNSLCPAGQLCDPAHHACIDQDQLDVCDGMPDLTPCTYSRGMGVCQQHVCLPTGCGNGRIDPGEMCDDGNQLGTDGCSADCSSDETCGNGVIDLALHETCDDRNHVDHDGCSSACTTEILRWQDLSTGPPARDYARAAYDASRDRIVLFGGNDAFQNVAFRDTWEWRGRWLATPPTTPPEVVPGYAMAYDHDRHKVVMEGGTQSKPTGFTYEWDGAAWNRIADGPATSDHAMGYDAHRHRMVIFGGYDQAFAPTNTTFEWDGTTWTQITTPAAPTPRISAAMTYDPDHGVILLYGGNLAPSASNNNSNELWKYDGTTWTKLAAGPPNLQLASFAYSIASHRAILFGGFTNAGAASNQTWAWNGTAWQQLAAGPPARADATLVDDGRKRLVLFGGETLPTAGGGNSVFGDTWIFDGTVWTQAPVPAARYDYAITTDTDRRRIVMFGGSTQITSSVETWELSDLGWQRVATTGPTMYTRPGMVYDEKRRQTVLFGGYPGPTNETWIWNGSAWTKKTPATSPPPRQNTPLVYDTEHETVLAYDCNGSMDGNDLWSWDGTTWTELHPQTTPPTRRSPLVGYDRIHHQLVMFGGGISVPPYIDYNDTWVYENANWRLVTPPSGLPVPSEREGFPLVWNPARGALTMIGAAGNIDDLWEWDGSWWRRISTSLAPRYRVQYNATAAPDGAGIDVLWGTSNSTVINESWQLRWDGPHAGDSCKLGSDRDGDGQVGCADSDCWTVCTPDCSPGMTCAPAASRCGDGTCDPAEDCHSCPADCTSCGAACGDFVCDPGETCPGDCP